MNPASPAGEKVEKRPSAFQSWFRIIAVAVLSGQATYLYVVWRERNAHDITDPAPAPSAVDGDVHTMAAFIAEGHAHLPSEQRYALRARELLAAAVADDRIAYRDIIEVAYGSGIINGSILARKAAWRKRWSNEFPFFADYSFVNDETPVRKVNAVQDPSSGETMAGIYAQPENMIVVSGRSPAVLFHEAGHVLQREAVSDLPGFKIPGAPNALEPRALDGTTEVFAAYQDGRLSSRQETRLSYLVTQKEFEMLLQDLNRAHAVLVGGGPIMNPKDTVRALHVVGLTQTREAVAAALVDTEWIRVSDEIDQLAYLERSPAGAEFFPDAARVIELRELSLRVDAAFWHKVYRKLLLEAPGHL